FYAAMLRNKSYVYNTLGMALFTFAFGGLQAWAPKYFVKEERIHVDTTALPVPADADPEEQRQAREKKANEVVTTWLGVVILVSGLLGTPLGGLFGDVLKGRWGPAAYFWVSGLSMLAAAPFILAALLVRSEWLIFTSLLVGLTLTFMQYGPTNTI